MSIVHVAVAMLFAGCVMGDPVNVIEEDARLDGNAAHIASTYQQYALVNAAPYASGLGAFDINVFVSSEAAAEYKKIDPANTGSNVVLPPGSAIVRAVLNDDKTVAKLTMMVKGVPGYDPSLGDWWFSVTDTHGNPIPDDSGKPQMGRLEACHSCHIPREADDYLFGTPASTKAHS